MRPSGWRFRPRRTFAIVSLLAITGAVSPAIAQTITPSTILQRPLPGTPAAPGAPGPQLPQRAPITLTPSVTVAEEYDDNVLMDNEQRRWDLITVLTPGIVFTAERPTWRFNLSYDFDSRFYAREPDRNNGFDRQNLLLDSFYRVDPTLTLSLDDSLRYTTGVNAFAPEGVVATGREKMFANTLRPGVTWAYDPQTTFRVFGAWTIARYQRQALLDSDTWRGDGEVERELTPRLRANLGYRFAFFDIREVPDVTTHTPRVGASYDFTPTMRGSLAAGPIFETPDGGATRITPYVAALLRKRYAWGETSLNYSHDVELSGGLSGTADAQTVGLSVVVTTLMRGLSLEFSPQYRTLDSDDNTVDIRTITIPFRAIYQITPWFGVMAGYSYLRQRSESTAISLVTGEVVGRNVDQNVVFVGVSFGYPIRFD